MTPLMVICPTRFPGKTVGPATCRTCPHKADCPLSLEGKDVPADDPAVRAHIARQMGNCAGCGDGNPLNT